MPLGTIKTIRDLAIAKKRVFIRVDFNVPLDAEGHITDDSRIVASLPTIKYAREQGARVILASHLGRPKGKKNPKESMIPVGARLAELLGCEVLVPDEPAGDGPFSLVSNLRENQVVLLENLRFHPGEEKDDEGFARELASLCDVYVDDAFGAAHRAHASISAITRFVSERGVGLLMEKEVEALGKLLANPERPFVAVLGGAKVSDKVALVENLLPRIDTLLIGGAMAYTFLKAKGTGVGASRVEEDKLDVARNALLRAEEKGVRIVLPVDHAIVDKVEPSAEVTFRPSDGFPPGGIGVDIGPETIELFASILASARTIFWNGPMGIFEMERFSRGTVGVASAISKTTAFSVVGGGDSVSAIKKAGVTPFISHISTGGGASLEFLEGQELPGLTAVARR